MRQPTKEGIVGKGRLNPEQKTDAAGGEFPLCGGCILEEPSWRKRNEAAASGLGLCIISLLRHLANFATSALYISGRANIC